MPSIILPCPHCLAEKVGFNIASEYRASVPRESSMDMEAAHPGGNDMQQL